MLHKVSVVWVVGSLYIGGSAMLTGSEQIIDKVKELTSSELEIGISDLHYKDGKFSFLVLT